MCHVTCVIFGVLNIIKEEVKGKKVIEIDHTMLMEVLDHFLNH